MKSAGFKSVLFLLAMLAKFAYGNDTTLYDVKHYDIHVSVNIDSQSISGYNVMQCLMLKSSSVLYCDLVPSMTVSGVTCRQVPLKFIRKQNKVIVTLETPAKTGEIIPLNIQFNGKPEVAILAPWKGGFDWKKDARGKDWVGLACESKGASIWLPCKDEWSDEAESMDMYLTVPQSLIGVSNGRLKEVIQTGTETTYHWQVLNPINNYNISINIGDYVLISDTFRGLNTLSLDYYVLSYNKEKAIRHFKEVDTMLRAFEHYFGAYPFPEDGYKLVETPYWGMEHQSCVAYGNKYRYNEFGFDFIIVHESGHEWFANSITAADPADLWIHESFTTYSEALYVEYTQGKEKALSYLLSQRGKVMNKYPMQGPKHQHYHGWKDNDIYYKGSWVLQTLRYSVNNDSLWFNMLREMGAKFRHQLISSEEMVEFICKRLPGIKRPVLDQYLNYSDLPFLYVKLIRGKGTQWLEYRWAADVKNFSMDLPVQTSKGTVVLRAGKSKRKTKVPADFTLNDILKLKEHALINVGVQE
ncbi:MAG: M1 family metallopeptidase [Chitinophagaceae bacterium]